MWTRHRGISQLGKKCVCLIGMCPNPAVVTFLLLPIDRHESRKDALVFAFTHIGDAINADGLRDYDLALKVETRWGLLLLWGRR